MNNHIDKKSRIINQTIIGVFIAISIFYSMLVSGFYNSQSSLLFGVMLGRWLILGLLPVFVYKRALGKLDDSFQKNKKKFTRATLILIGLSSFLFFATRGDMEEDFQKDKSIGEVKDSMLQMLDTEENGKFKLPKDNETELGKFVNEMFAETATYLNEYQGKVALVEMPVLKGVEDFKDSNKLIALQKAMQKQFDLESTFLNEYPKIGQKYEVLLKEKSKTSDLFKEFNDGLLESVSENAVLFEEMSKVTTKYYTTQISFYQFMIKNQNAFEVTSGEIQFSNTNLLDQYNSLLTDTIEAENQYLKMKEEANSKMETATNNLNSL